MIELEYQEYIQHTHNVFCKIVIRHAAIDMALRLRKQWGKEISLDYWCTIKNSHLAVTFEYKGNQFFLRSFGAFDCIPDHWDK